jgi:chromosome segregation ATPase
MSADFTNIYQEILLDNLVAIIKQNFAFQTQIKLSENAGQRNVELEKQVQQLQDETNQLKLQLQGNTNQLQIYKNKAEQNNSAHEEKSRIQVALNNELQKSSSYKEEIDKKNADIIKLSNEMKVIEEELETLKELVPVSKLKKMEKQKPVEVVKEEPKIQKFIKPVDIKPLKFESGGTF